MVAVAAVVAVGSIFAVEVGILAGGDACVVRRVVVLEIEVVTAWVVYVCVVANDAEAAEVETCNAAGVVGPVADVDVVGGIIVGRGWCVCGKTAVAVAATVVCCVVFGVGSIAARVVYELVVAAVAGVDVKDRARGLHEVEEGDALH